ncbi:MAG: C10 family peptidase [Bacteroidales bacterium]|nr:C10 family peptidase [Bacteroidales bacterium]
MKKLVLTLSLASLMCFVFGQQVDVNTAQTIARNYIKAMDVKHSSDIASVQTKTDANQQPVFYVFNFTDGGFVLVAADNRMDPILAYSLTNEYKINKIPACDDFVTMYEQKIADIRTQNAPAEPEIAKEWASLATNKIQKANTTSIILITSKWNQDKYYNALCPDEIDAPNGYDLHVPNGCGAVAMAQLFYYHRYPRSGYGSSAYVSENYGKLSANYAATNYDYEAMTDATNNYSDAIARLIYHCGVAVKMDYDAEGSGCVASDVVTAIKGRFLYATTVNIKSKAGYSDADWLNLIKTDINDNCPVYYSAFNGGSGVHAGHAFICDGYDSDNKLHINWGWGGYNDGFFALNNMNGYTLSNQAIFGIKPRVDTTNFFTGTKTLTATFGSFDDGSCRLKYRNNTNCSWLISPGENTTSITLNVSRFATENGKDIVKIYAGNEANDANLKATYSGDVAEGTYITINNAQAFITFTSDSDSTRDGFRFTYTSSKTSHGYCSTTSNPIKQTSATGSITNGSDNSEYDKDMTCYWTIAPNTNPSKVGIIFKKFDIGQGDKVELMKQGSSVGAAMKYPTHGQYRFSKDNMPTLDSIYVVNSNAVYVKFLSDNVDAGTGWEIAWIDNVNISENEAGFGSIKVYPNPANSILNVEVNTINGEDANITLYNVLGEMVANTSTADTRATINVDNLAKGMYLLKITSSKGSTTKKVTIQ